MLGLERTEKEVDHLIQAGTGLVGAFGDQLRMKETNHRGTRAERGRTRTGHVKLAGSDTISDHLRYSAGDAVQMWPTNIPIFLHGDRDHVMHFRIADIAVRIHPVDG